MVNLDSSEIFLSNGRSNYLLAIVPIKHSIYLIQLNIILCVLLDYGCSFVVYSA